MIFVSIYISFKCAGRRRMSRSSLRVHWHGVLLLRLLLRLVVDDHLCQYDAHGTVSGFGGPRHMALRGALRAARSARVTPHLSAFHVLVPESSGSASVPARWYQTT